MTPAHGSTMHLFSVLALAIVADACSGTTAPADGASGDATPVDAVTDTAPPTHAYTFVIDQLTVDPDDLPDNPHTGFNLDGLFSSALDANGCNHADYFASLDPDQNCPQLGGNGACAVTPNPGCDQGHGGCVGGVDNQLPGMGTGCLSCPPPGESVRLALANHKIVLLVRVSGITDPADRDQASSVRVSLYVAYPTFTTGCEAVVPPGATYAIARSSLLAGATTIEQARYAFDAQIRGGRLIVAADRSGLFPFPNPPIRGTTLVLPMHAVHLRADITASGLARGALGGWVSGNDVVDAVTAIAPDYANVVRGAIGGLVDIQLDGICDDSTTGTRRFGGVSMGFGLHAVPAVIDPTTPIADTQATGTCGYVAYADAGPGPG